MEVSTDHDILFGLGEELPVGIWVARVPDGEQVYANRMYRETLGIEARYDASTGGFVACNVHGRDGKPYPESRMPFVRALTERRAVICDDLTIHRSDGKRIEVRAVARPLGNPVSHIVVSYVDVSREVAAERARAETEQRLRRAQRLEAIGSLAGGIAHDFNNLIFGIKLLAADVAGSQTDPKVRQVMADIDDITDRSAVLTRSLLGFARRSKHRSMSVNLNDLVTSMTELLGRTLSGIELSFDLEASDRGAVVGDQAQLEQVVMNLVLHASDAMHAQGRIVVRTLDRTPEDPQAARHVVLEIADDSAGISEQVVDRTGEPYATARNTGGETDAGLATVFGIVESHGGKVEVDTGLDGAGTTLRVVLPAAPRSAARIRLAAADLPRGTGAVMVVDDDAMVRKVVAGSLASLGYTPVEAASGSDAIEIYRQRRGEIRAVLLDMMMRGMTGRATYLGLREVNPAVPVLLMSGHTLNEQVQEILDLGVRSFVSKPYSMAQLATAMADLLRG